jgi:choline dehydrogenase
VMRPFSRGRVLLAGRDPGGLPILDPNYFGDERDPAHDGHRVASGASDR